MVKVLIVGGTGPVGRTLSKLFLSSQTPFLIGSRNPIAINNDNDNVGSQLTSKWIHMDLTKDEGINKSIDDDVDTILYLASLPHATNDNQLIDVTLTKNLLNSIQKKNIKHLIYLSIVGVDKMPYSYYKGKLECERLIKESGIPYTILRATQFHSLVEDFANYLLNYPMDTVSKVAKIQPIQVEAVAMELAKIVQEPPLNGTYDIGGRKIYTMKETADLLLKARPEKKPVDNMPIIGEILNEFAEGYNTCDNISLNSNTWEEYLANKYPK
ncbi:unnamed protein product [Rotaria sordida]|uniref:NADH dehydrogenase [ubiquinone] 1 alpha subcomplex subunit 9, mitochondrial n=1 Tax=Rotaria sordida TaxID=392033 RepID=A0A813UUG0_9BILA|nr:unnamed protein product [Rotaria sordida]